MQHECDLLMSGRCDYRLFSHMRMSYSVFLLSGDKIDKKNQRPIVFSTYRFNRQFIPLGRPVIFTLAAFSLIFSVSPRISGFSHFLFLYFILHGRMHAVSVTWKYPCFSLAPGMQIFIRCLPRRSSSIPLCLTWDEPKTYDWDTLFITKTKNKNIRKTRRNAVQYNKNKRKCSHESYRLTRRFQFTVRTDKRLLT